MSGEQSTAGPSHQAHTDSPRHLGQDPAVQSLRAALSDAVAAEGAAVVSAASRDAAAIGIQIMAEGGNAFDAAVAMALAETVTLPMKCGIAGDVIAMVRNARVGDSGGAFEVVQSVGRGPAALDRGGRLTITGPCSVGVPGAPHGYALLAARGRLPLSRLVAPAAAIARNGFFWSRTAHVLTVESAELLRRHNQDGCAYLPDGAPAMPGDKVSLPGLAELLEEFALRGEELFFGDIGAAIAEWVQRSGGFVEAQDFRCRPARVLVPLTTDLGGGVRLMTSPAPTHGADLTQLLAGLAGRWGDAAAVLDAFANHGDAERQEGTSLVAAADADGNAVMLMHSNSFPRYGSGLVVEPWQLILNNRPGRGFSLDAPPDHPNAPRGGRVPRTTLHVWAVADGGGAWLGATPGGHNQLPWNLQVASSLLAGERRLARLVTAPLWGQKDKGGLTMEADHPLLAGGAPANAQAVPPLSMRSSEQILHIETGSARRSAAADPRGGALALALPEAGPAR